MNVDSTFSTSFQIARHTYSHVIFRGIGSRLSHIISAHRRFLSTTIDVLPNHSLPLYGDSTVAAHQCRVAMSFHTRTGTEHVTHDSGGTATCLTTYLHRGMHLHTAYLTTAIDVTGTRLEFSILNGSYRAVTDSYRRRAIGIIGNRVTSVIYSHHGFRTCEFVGLTLAATEHATSDGDALTFRQCH